MSLRANLPTVAAQSSITLTKVPLLQQLEAVVDAGLTHCLNAVAAQLVDGIVTCNDLVTGELVQSSRTPPVINAAINSKPTLTHGSGAVGVAGQIVRANKVGALDLGTGAWSICMLIRAMGTGSTDYILGSVPFAKAGASDYSPVVRFSASGDKTLAPALVTNDLATARSFCNTKEFYNTNRLLCLTHTPGVGMKWYIDNWSTPEKTDTAAIAQSAFTDGRFVVGSLGAGVSSLNFAGSWAVMTCHNVDLSLNNPARRGVMQAIAAYGGITSS
ncbi:hypothetical protein GOA58_05855 [Sinorhizobium meliloti]|uniref:hypothetical protein n=1 Tax=Rhizobium meliloti TaxID=382 RepID=UPI00299D9775|nr:hypothetical protein [Sinorhizobium meliloti]MDW9660100.1 hypothetical protein [Sinorhizobium meliloti]MDX0049669.1 hypothetical protein [Sinorhizobium meliloti]